MSKQELTVELRGVTACAVALLQALDGGRITAEEMAVIRECIEGTTERLALDYQRARWMSMDMAERVIREASRMEAQQ